MILFYAMGSGYGHVSRAVATIHTLELDPSNVTILTNNPGAEDPRVNHSAGVHVVDPTAITRKALWPLVKPIVQAQDVECIFVDAFPGGIAGELCGMGIRVPMLYIGRWMHWARYEDRLGLAAPHFSTAYLTEPLHPDQMDWVRAHADALTPLDLIDPPVDPDPADIEALEAMCGDRPLWLVVKGNPQEAKRMAQEALAASWAADPKPKVVLISPRRPDGMNPKIGHLDASPSYPLYSLAERLFLPGTPATYRQTRDYEGEVTIINHPRRFDDQALREAWHAAGFSGETFG